MEDDVSAMLAEDSDLPVAGDEQADETQSDDTVPGARVRDALRRESRYARLGSRLRQVDHQANEFGMTLREVEGAMEAPLPPSAFRHSSWWANDTRSHPQSREWIAAGWRVSQIDLKAERVYFSRIPERQQAYQVFFEELLHELAASAPDIAGSYRAGSRHWLTLAPLKALGRTVGALGCSFALHGQFRVEVYLDTGDGQTTKAIFDALFDHRDQIELGFGGELEWERLPNRRASRIAACRRGHIDSDPSELRDLRSWAVQTVPRLYSSVRAEFDELSDLSLAPNDRDETIQRSNSAEPSQLA